MIITTGARRHFRRVAALATVAFIGLGAAAVRVAATRLFDCARALAPRAKSAVAAATSAICLQL